MNKKLQSLDSSDNEASFWDLNVNPEIIKQLDTLGYVSPTPIQAKIIPHFLENKDIIGQAQTGTGKTAAFALPILSNIINNTEKESYSGDRAPKALILAPTRELAMQVADSFRKYCPGSNKLAVAALCGGQDYRDQLRQLKKGLDIVVGTPGRIMDHIDRGTLVLSSIKTMVLDEADEMLRMGFIEDINWILERMPSEKQTALFSATMPKAIKNIALKYLNSPIKVHITPVQSTSNLISQYYWGAKYSDKIKTLIRFIEILKYDTDIQMDALIIFARTKAETLVVEKELLNNNYKAVAINGDIDQKRRERAIRDLKEKKIDYLIATDVAARGLDVDRITHVFNYDMPHDVETYMHRIGRTGRAGKKGMSISFVTRSEFGLIRDIEQSIKSSIEKYTMPSIEDINNTRVDLLKQRILKNITNSNKTINREQEFIKIINVIKNIKNNEEFTDFSWEHMVAALVKMLYNKSNLLLNEGDLLISDTKREGNFNSKSSNSRSFRSGGRGERSSRSGGRSSRSGGRSERSFRSGGRSEGSDRSERSGGRSERSFRSGGRSEGSERSGGRSDRSERSFRSGGRSEGSDRSERSGGRAERSFRSGGRAERSSDRSERSGGRSERSGGRSERSNGRSDRPSRSDNNISKYKPRKQR